MTQKELIQDCLNLCMVHCEDLNITQSTEEGGVVYVVVIKGIFPTQFNDTEKQKAFARSLNTVVSKISGNQLVDVRMDFSRVTFTEEESFDPNAISVFFSNLLKSFVRFPDEVSVAWERGETFSEITFTASSVDLGAISGARGNYILALRRLMETFGYRAGQVLRIGSPKDTSGIVYTV